MDTDGLVYSYAPDCDRRRCANKRDGICRAQKISIDKKGKCVTFFYRKTKRAEED